MQTLFLLLFLPLQLFHHCWSNIACQGFCSLTHEIFIGNSETLMFYHVIISFILSTLKMRIILSYFSYFGHSLIPKWQHSRNGHDSHNNTSACRLKCNKVCFLNLYWQHSQMYPFLPFFILIFRLLIYSFQVYLWICF